MYKTDQVETLFNCEICLKTVVSPVTLPCGNNVCQSHLQMHLGKEQFRCQLCGDEHHVPKKGFQINKNIQRGLEMELHKAFGSNPAFEECKSHIENAAKVIRQLEVLRDSPEGYIYDYFEEVKRQVDLRREKLKNEIDLASDQMIDRIERTRAECIQVSALIKGIFEDLEVFSGELERIRDQLNSLAVSEAKLSRIKGELVALERGLDEKCIKEQHLVLQNNEYFFEFDEINIGSVFGGLRKNEILFGGKYSQLTLYGLL